MLVNGGQGKDASWKVQPREWLEVEKDERIGVGQAAKPTNALGKGLPPRIYYYKRAKAKPKAKPKAAAAAGGAAGDPSERIGPTDGRPQGDFWTAAEDAKLRRLVAQDGGGDWEDKARRKPHRGAGGIRRLRMRG